MSDADRAETMAVKLAAYARHAGAEPEPVVAAYERSVRHRLAVLGDVFHPDLLHPARTALILMLDADCRDGRGLAAGALCESEFPGLRIALDEIRSAFGVHVAELVAALPLPEAAGERLLEDLVSAPDDVALIAVAERLDHARHLHFRDAAVWPAFVAQIDDVYLPVARRLSEPLATRLERWSRSFSRRKLRSL